MTTTLCGSAAIEERAETDLEKRVMQRVYREGHRIVRYLVFAHFALSLVFAAYYETWIISIGISSLAMTAFLLCAWLRPDSFLTRAMTGVVLQVFCALHIYQFHGLAEMHFFFFTSFAVMIVYADRLCMWPGCFLIIGQHILFAVLHNRGVKVEFFEEDYVSIFKLSLHFGIALFHVGICSTWAHLNRRRILVDASHVVVSHQLERRTYEREQLLTSIIDSTPSVVYAKDLDGRFVLVNKKFLEIFNLSRDAVINRTNHDIFPRDIADVFRANDLAVAAQRGPLITEERAPQADGVMRFYHSEKFPIINDQGQVTMTCGVSIDITEKVEANAVIAAQQAKLTGAAKLSALGEMAGGIAHEINNPLAIIQGKARQLARDLMAVGASPETLQPTVTIIAETAHRIAKIVKGLRNFSRDGGGDPMKIAGIQDVVDDALSMCQEKIKSHGVRMTVAPYADAVLIECRAIEIAQILVNLFNNAFDAVITADERWIRTEYRVVGDDVEIRIENSGPLIPSELRERIMLPFFSTKPVGKGTGLGLSISKGLAEAHGGFLRLDASAPHTTFVLRLPKTQEMLKRSS